jgi:predicted transcriptional regulator
MSTSFQKELAKYLLCSNVSITEVAQTLGLEKAAILSWLEGKTSPCTSLAQVVLDTLELESTPCYKHSPKY